MSKPGIGTAPGHEPDPQAKDKFKKLPSDFKDAVAQSSREEIYKRLAALANQVEELAAAKELDNDLAAAKDRYDTASEPYKLQAKDLKLRIKFCVRCINDKGGV